MSAPDAFVDVNEWVLSCICARESVTSLTHLVIARWRNEEKTKEWERIPCLNGDPMVRTCALFNGEWRVLAEGKGSKWEACGAAEGCENALLKRHARPRICRNHHGIVSKPEVI